MSDPWEVLERYSDPELIELSKKLDTELSKEELKIIEDWINHLEYRRIGLFIILFILTFLGLAFNLGAIIIPLEFSQYPAFALTHTMGALCWNIAVIKLSRPSVYKRFIEILEAIKRAKKPVLVSYIKRYTLTIPFLGFFWLVFSFLRPEYILYKNTIAALSDVITLHIEIITPFTAYLTLKLTKTPLLIPYCSGYAVPRYYRFKASCATKKLWKTAEKYKPLVLIKLFSVILIVIVINTFFLILLARLLGIKHTPHDVEIFSRVAPVVTLGATPVLTVVLRNLLSKIPLKKWIDIILGIINAVIIIVFCLPIISCIIVYYQLV